MSQLACACGCGRQVLDAEGRNKKFAAPLCSHRDRNRRYRDTQRQVEIQDGRPSVEEVRARILGANYRLGCGYEPDMDDETLRAVLA